MVAPRRWVDRQVVSASRAHILLKDGSSALFARNKQYFLLVDVTSGSRLATSLTDRQREIRIIH